MRYIFICILLISSYIDIKQEIVDTRINILLVIIGIITNGFNIVSILLYTLLPISLILINLFYKKETIGYGDIELIFSSAFFLGYIGQVISFFIACLLLCIYSLIIKRKKVPFVPFITIGIVIYMLATRSLFIDLFKASSALLISV